MEWIKANIKHVIAIGVILIMHIVGFFGLTSSSYSTFAQLTPINLLVTFLAILLTIKLNSKTFWLFFSFSFIVGMIVEIVGVKTGFPFGDYYYTDLLSIQLLDVPVLIGVNWFILSYIIISLVNSLQLKNYMIKVILGGLIMTFLDLLIEPFAIRYGLWVWSDQVVPLSNYLAWFVISSFIFLFGFNVLKLKSNVTAISTLIIYLIFFGLNLLF